MDYFEDELVLNGYDWRKVLDKYLLDGTTPLINNIVAGRMLVVSPSCSGIILTLSSWTSFDSSGICIRVIKS